MKDKTRNFAFFIQLKNIFFQPNKKEIQAKKIFQSNKKKPFQLKKKSLRFNQKFPFCKKNFLIFLKIN